MLIQLLEQISSYLLGKIKLHKLEEWLIANLQTILDSGDQKAIDIANELDADLIEFSESLIDESTIREHLQGYTITNPVIYINRRASSVGTLSIEDSVPVHEYEFKLEPV